MVAVPTGHEPVPAVPPTGAGRLVDAVHGRRAVAVAVSAMELLRPRSDLARMMETFDQVDLLFVADDYSRGGDVVPLPTVDAADAVEEFDDEDDDDDADPAEEIRRGVAALGLSEVSVHRLGLPLPLPTSAETDVVAAMSELVGFDPEPGVYCVAPASAIEPARSAVNRAAQRIAQVYGLPLLRYRCLELSVVGSDD